MQKALIFKAYDGTEIIDTTPEAEIRYFNMVCMEDLHKSRQRREETKKQSLTYRLKMALIILGIKRGLA